MATITLKNGVLLEYEFYKRQNQIKDGERDIPVIFLNGTIFNYRQWFVSFLPAFKKKSNNRYSYLLYNYQGVGRSTELDESYSLQTMVDNLTYLMDELEIENAHLFGASIGNMIGQMMTGQHPTRVKSLSGYGIVSLLGDLSATKKNYEDRVSEIRKLGPLLLERINSNNFKEIVRNVYTRSIFGRPYQELSLKEKLIHKLLERRVFPMLEGTPVKSMELVFSYYIKSIDTEKKLYLENLKNIDKTIPILFLHGTADSITSLEAAKMILEYLPQAKFIEFEGYEHIAPALKKKEGKAIMEKYVSFLNSVS